MTVFTVCFPLYSDTEFIHHIMDKHKIQNTSDITKQFTAFEETT